MPVRQGVRIFGGRADSRDCGQLRMLSRDVLIEKVLEGLHHVDGTCVEFLQRKMRKDNRSGYTGVAQTRSGRWRASITFKGKRYHLGTYDSMEDAVKVRWRGEEMHDRFLEEYYWSIRNSRRSERIWNE